MKKSIILLVVALAVIGFYSSRALAQYQGPTGDPPANNRSRPVDISDLAQTKTGVLTVKNGLNVGTTNEFGQSPFQVGSNGTLSLQGTVNINGALVNGALSAVNTAGHGVVGESSGNSFAGVYGLASAPGPAWAGFFQGPMGVSQYLVVGGAAVVGFTNPGDAYFYGRLNVGNGDVGDQICLNENCISNWSDVGGYWTASGNNIYNNNVGNVGIGTTNPGTYKLYVSGAGYYSGGLTSGGTIIAISDVRAQGSDFYDDSGDAHLSGEDSVYIKMDYNNDDADTRSIIFGKNTTLGTAPAGANELMRLTEVGNLGLGTNAPNQLFHIYRDIGNNAEIDLQSVAGANQHWAIYHDRNTEDLRFWHNDIAGEKNALTVKNTTGNVGIGTINPEEKLQVTSDTDARVLVSSTGANNSASIKLRARESSSNRTWYINSIGGASQPYNRLSIAYAAFDNNPLEMVTVTPGGDVGIGTNNPSARLELRRDIVFVPTILRVTDVINNPEFQLQYGNNANDHWGFYVDKMDGNNDLKIWQGSDLLTILRSNGYIGIGTTNPPVKLTVDSGNVFVKGPNNFASDGDTAVICYGDYNHCVKSTRGTGLELRVPGGGDSISAISVADNTGNVDINGTVLMGWERVGVSCSPGTLCQMSCSDGRKLLSGGCNTYGNTLSSSYPEDEDTWTCRTTTSVSMTAWVICARIAN